MNTTEIVSLLKNHKGQNLRIQWARPMKMRADSPYVITKQVTCFIRAGINYANLASVQWGIATGQRKTVEKLPWGEWTEFPFVIRHNDTNYLRLYPSSFQNLRTREVKYFIDGKEIEESQARMRALASEFREREMATSAFTVKVNDIVYVGGPETVRHPDGTTSSNV